MKAEATARDQKSVSEDFMCIAVLYMLCFLMRFAFQSSYIVS
jgi:hypothetical protein